ncbi:MAG: DUF2634 domain-containing protein [Oscillospiraceae bacterium]|nr:DUF2634 domain-containing protein [Oscillospiraceae bacterium]
MIPSAYDNMDYTVAVRQPSKTYRLTEDGHIRGIVDGIDALKQTVYCILMTQRFEHPIYSHSYGFDKNAVIGGDIPYVYAKIKNEIIDALMQDDRIESVDEFQFSATGKKQVLVRFTVSSSGRTAEMEAVISV